MLNNTLHRRAAASSRPPSLQNQSPTTTVEQEPLSTRESWTKESTQAEKRRGRAADAGRTIREKRDPSPGAPLRIEPLRAGIGFGRVDDGADELMSTMVSAMSLPAEMADAILPKPSHGLSGLAAMSSAPPLQSPCRGAWEEAVVLQLEELRGMEGPLRHELTDCLSLVPMIHQAIGATTDEDRELNDFTAMLRGLAEQHALLGAALARALRRWKAHGLDAEEPTDGAVFGPAGMLARLRGPHIAYELKRARVMSIVDARLPPENDLRLPCFTGV